MVGKLSADARAGHVVITHMRMGLDPSATIASVRGLFDGAVSLARPGARFMI